MWFSHNSKWIISHWVWQGGYYICKNEQDQVEFKRLVEQNGQDQVEFENTIRHNHSVDCSIMRSSYWNKDVHEIGDGGIDCS